MMDKSLSSIKNYTLELCIVLILFSSCRVRPAHHISPHSSIPDYSQASYWAALPTEKDLADEVPSDAFQDQQSESEVDVFFLHPTTYTGDKGQNFWNSPIDDKGVQNKTDATAILHQASIFNAAGRVFAPRYRQAHLRSYFDKKHPKSVEAAFELAYADVKRAFTYYLQHYNGDRPLIIAAHSQGTGHAARLLKEFFDGTELYEQLVVAYLVGLPIPRGYFNNIALCSEPTQTHCFCSWRTFKRGYMPRRFPKGDSIAVVNPLSWQVDTTYVPKSMNKGGVLRDFHAGTQVALTDAQIVNGVLWASKPKFPGSILLTIKNYHVGDYNLYWVNVRENASQRADAYLSTLSGE
ncbi:MAG: DUF3089 domain-containing protein [Saprospiraceae bacterium]|nr:DUF3089 domain-containing protein [Saprospiraceae bacterium]